MPPAGSALRASAPEQTAAPGGGLRVLDTLPPNIEPFSALPASGFLSMAPVPVLAAGVKLFQEGWGGALASPRPGRLDAADGGVEAVIWVDGGRLHSSCTCPESGRVTNCRHVCALFAGTMAVLHGRIPGGAAPNPGPLRRFQQAFTPPEAAAESRPAPAPFAAAGLPPAPLTPAAPPPSENRLELVCNNGYMIRWRGIIPRMVWDSLGAMAMHRTFSYLPLSSFTIISTLRSLLAAGAACQIPLVFRRDNRVSPPLFSPGRAGSWRLLLNRLPGGAAGIGLGLELDGVCPVPFIDDLGGEGAILHTGELVETPGSADEAIFQQFARHHSGVAAEGPLAQSARWEAAVPAEEFNARSLAVAMGGKPGLWDGVAAFADGKSVPIRPRAEDLEARLVFNVTPNPHSGGSLVGLVADFGEFRVSLEPACEVVAGHLYRQGRAPHLTRNARRMSVMFAAAGLLHQAQDRDGVRQILGQALRDESLFPRGIRGEARQILEDYHRLFVAPGREPLECPVATPDGGWRFVAVPVEKIARAVTALPEMAARWAPGRQTGGAAGLAESPRAAAGRLNTLAQALGGAVSFDGREVSVRRFDVRVDVRRGEEGGGREIDWFELRPEVACGSLSIPQEEWEQLLLGGLFETPDGGLVLPDEQSLEILKRVAGLCGPRKRKARRGGEEEGADPRAHTLEVVEWLELRKLGVRVSMPDEIALIIESLANFERVPETRLPADFKARLRPYQKRGYDWLAFLYTHRLGACLADDMGLGKTLQAIAFLHALTAQTIPAVRDSYLQYPHLVVVPPSLLFNWQNELRKFSPGLKVAEYSGPGRDLEKARRADIVVTTYDLMRIDSEKLASAPFHAVVFDEAQLLKNHKSSRAQAARLLRRGFTLCLTGTPVENHAGEYHSILSLAVPGLLGEYDDFLQAAKADPAGAVARARPVVLRRAKEEILKELPPKTEQDIGLDMTAEQRECYTRMVAEIKEEVAKAYNLKPAQQAGIVALTCLMRLRQICISPALIGRTVTEPAPKFVYLIGKLRELRDQGHSALVFSQFTGALDIACAEAGRAGLHHIRLDGSTPAAKRKALVEKFQTSARPLFFFISLRSGGTGLTLTRASYVFHLDPWWNPAVENQASDRAHRIGQRSHVFVQRLVMRGSVEEKMMVLKDRKRRIFEEIVGGGPGRTAAGLITAEDVKYLLG